MVVTAELDDPIAPSRRTGYSQSRLDSLGAGVAEDHQLCRGHNLADDLGERCLVAIAPTEADPGVELATYRVQDNGRRLPKEHRAERQGEIDVLIAVDVPDVAKSSINYGGYKNQLGTFYPPAEV